MNGMKNKILLSAVSVLGTLCALSASPQQTSDEQAPVRETVVAADTVLPEASSQYALDSLRYAWEYKQKTRLEELRTERYLDSVVYAQMNENQLYRLQMSRQDRYWESETQRFFEGPFVLLVSLAFVLVAFGMVLRARDRGKQRSQELKLAQLEAMKKGQIVFLDRKTEQDRSCAPDEPISEPYPGDVSDYTAVFEQTRRQAARYLRSPRRYRKTGVLLILFAFGTMLFFGLVGSGDAWVLGIVPLFIGFAYLYLDYVSLKTEQQRREMEEFRRYKAEKAAGKSSAEVPETPAPQSDSQAQEGADRE